MSAKEVIANGPSLHSPDPVSRGRVAVVTGAASGIGFGLAERFAAEGLHVVMADVEEPALSKAAAALAEPGASVLPVVTDVADLSAVEALRDAALSRLAPSTWSATTPASGARMARCGSARRVSGTGSSG